MKIFNRTKIIPWDEFFRIENPDPVTLRVIPDRTLNNKENYKLARALHDLYTAPLGRLGIGKYFVSYTPQARVWYDVVLTKKAIKFYVTVPKRWEVYVRQKIYTVWPKASIEVADRKEVAVPLQDTSISEMAYRRHNIFALHTDRAQDTQPLGAIMAATADFQDDDLARLSICAEPNNRMNWADHAENAHALFRKGKTPQRTGLNSKRALLSVGTNIENLFQSLSNTFLVILGHDEEKKGPDYDKREILLDGKLDTATTSKKTEPTFKTRIRIASHSKDKNRRELNARAIANSYVEVSGDNELERLPVKKKGPTVRILFEMNNHKLNPRTLFAPDTNIMSAGELGKLMQLPGPGLQDEFSEQLESIQLRQVELPPAVTSGGIHIATQQVKDKKIEVYQPVDDWDELCLPHTTIAGMGQGKTKGFAANWVVESVRNGFGALVVDPAKGEAGDEIAHLLPPEKILRINLAETRICLSWDEIVHSPRAKSRLANTMIAFFDAEKDETGMQTARYIRAAVMGMQTGKLSEVIRIFEDDVYRERIIKQMPDGLPKTTLIAFGKEKDGRRAQILSPIYNRLDVILSDEYLAECMESEESLDMVEILSKPQAVVIDIPSKVFDPVAMDIIVNLLATKIDLAMRLREEANQFPFFVLFDEPHQYLRSATLWKAAAVESRKWRIGYVWLFHSWEQIPKDLTKIIKAAGCHYHIYPSSEETYKDLASYIAPFTPLEGIAMPRFHAINVIRAANGTIKPFIAKMLAPPHDRKPA